MLALNEALKRFKEGVKPPIRPVEGIAEALIALNRRADTCFVCKINDSMVVSDKYGQDRHMIVGSHKVASLLTIGPVTYVLMSAAPVDRILFIMYLKHEENHDTISSGEVILNMTEDDVSSYYLDIELIDAEQRIDYMFYTVENLRLEKALAKYPALEDFSTSIRNGSHASFRKAATPFLLRAVHQKILEPSNGQHSFYAPFIGLDNISPIGCIEGPLCVYDLDKRPKNRPVKVGEIIMSLITSSSKKEGVSNIGKSAIIEQGEEYYVNQSFGIISPHRDINPYFLQLSLGSEYFIKQISRYRKPSSKLQDSITLNDLKKMRIVTYDNKKMNALGLMHKRRIMAYKDLLQTMILDQELIGKLDNITQQRKIELPGYSITENNRIRNITRKDTIGVIERIFCKSAAPTETELESASLITEDAGVYAATEELSKEEEVRLRQKAW